MIHLLVIALASATAGVAGRYLVDGGMSGLTVLLIASGSACLGVVIAAAVGYLR